MWPLSASRGPKKLSTLFSVPVSTKTFPSAQDILERKNQSLSVANYLQNRLHVGADESGGIGDQVPQHAGTLFLDSSNAAVLQLCQNL